MGTNGPAESDWAARVEQELVRARIRFQTETNSAEAAWQLGRACYDVADLATNRTERAKIAEEGIDVCRQSISRKTNSAPAHYYLGMNLGQLADTKRNMAALKMVKEMEREFQAARDLDKQFDSAGPDRNLGLLYLQAPVVVSIGSRSKARQHLRNAVDLAPEYPENRLNLLETYLKWGEPSSARREAKALDELWPEAQRKFTGEAWAASWPDWERRLKTAKKRIEAASKTIQGPHHGD
jgi:tetratricopeptide (TPR) repeat protein